MKVTTLDAADADRAAGALLGLAAGDALGAGYEFEPDPPPDPEMIGGGPFGFAPGEWTDDTQVAICITEVAATGRLDPSRDRKIDEENVAILVLPRSHHGSDESQPRPPVSSLLKVFDPSRLTDPVETHLQVSLCEICQAEHGAGRTPRDPSEGNVRDRQQRLPSRLLATAAIAAAARQGPLRGSAALRSLLGAGPLP